MKIKQQVTNGKNMVETWQMAEAIIFACKQYYF